MVSFNICFQLFQAPSQPNLRLARVLELLDHPVGVERGRPGRLLVRARLWRHAHPAERRDPVSDSGEMVSLFAPPVVMFSAPFFKSEACAEELTKICEKGGLSKRVIPVFVGPLDLPSDFLGPKKPQRRNAGFIRAKISGKCIPPSDCRRGPIT